jgi:glucan endo-1,3-beta-D-glucosidase
MRFTSTAFALAAALSTADAAYKGFNYGAFFGNNAAKQYVDFKYEFEAAKTLPGTNGQFTSARLYTMLQHGTTKDYISAIQAAIDTKTTLLLGLWTSASTPAAAQTGVNNELAAFQAAIDKFGKSFTDLIAGISVGSEDLYRITPTAIKNGEKNPGAQPADLAKYIDQVKAFRDKNTLLKGKLVGHVDTWTAYVNGTNKAVVDRLEWVGVDAYPFWETEHANAVGNGKTLFYDAYNQVKAVSQGKPIWITETGWPVSGPTQGQAVANSANAKTYWNTVACQLMKDNVNLWYYTLQDVQYGNPSPSFGVKPGGDLKAVNPLFDLTCPNSAKFVSLLLPIFLSSLLSPLYLLVLYNVSVLSFRVTSLLPAAHTSPPCNCRLNCRSSNGFVHPLDEAERPLHWVARANGLAKPSDTVTATLSSGIAETPSMTDTLSASCEKSRVSFRRWIKANLVQRF